MAILKLKCQEKNYELSEEILSFLATNIQAISENWKER